MIVETKTCPSCREPGSVDVDASEYRAFEYGRLLVQDAMPTTPAPVLEQLITGMHPACWDAMAAEEEW
jgi:hypothetical protein